MYTYTIKSTLPFALFLLLLSNYACKSTSTESPGKDRSNTPATIMVFSAASLTNVLNEFIDSFAIQQDIVVKTNLASSGTLARQVSQGEPPDIFISASPRWANYIDSLNLFEGGSPQVVAYNQLVLIAPQNHHIPELNIDKSLDLASLLQENRLSMGDPSHVPAGKYALQALTHFHLYNSIKDKMLPAKDVRSALMVVEMEEAPLGIVYRTDAIKSEKVKILATFPPDAHQPIKYVAGICRYNPQSTAFIEFLNSKTARAIWIKHGFTKP